MVRRSIRSAVRQRIATVNKQFREEVLSEMRDIGRDVEAEFKKVTEDWEHKVKFKSNVDIGRDFIELKTKAAGPNKDIFNFVDKGTEGPYEIKPKNPDGYLVFQNGYSAKTAPMAKYKQGTGQSSGSWAKKKSIIHPGIEARDFSGTIMKKIRPPFRRGIENAFRRAARR